MIVIPAKVRCDFCLAETEVELQVITNVENNTCTIEIYRTPNGWYFNKVYGEHRCSNHREL